MSHSHTAQSSSTTSSDMPPPSPLHTPKRSRKAINCQPCRASKLKCDRSRPCSSCVLRGTSALCYPQGHPDSSSPSHNDSRLDPQVEIQKIRQSLAAIESHILRPNLSLDTQPRTPLVDDHNAHCTVSPPSATHPDNPYMDNKSAPATLAKQTDAGFYAGPTSSATHLVGLKESAEIYSKAQSGDPIGVIPSPDTISLVDDQEDHELLKCLPESHIVDQILLFFIDHCCPMNMYIQKSTLFNMWEIFKMGQVRARLTLALVFAVTASVIQFLPPQDQLFLYIRRDVLGTIAELSDWYYDNCCQALVLHEIDCPMPSLDLVEVHLLQMFYLGISKNHAEEIWRLRGCVTSMALALGLHRDPSKWNMPHPMAERRRWAWFNVLRVERWHAFLFGRPIAFSNSHFDTVFPSSINPYNVDRASARDHLPYIHFFRLMILYGDIMHDMVSVRPVPYENIMAHHKALQNWLNTFPDELKFNTANIATAFSGNDVARRRSGVQSLCFKLAGLHTQLAMHRPYATNAGIQSHPRGDQSLQLATAAANEIILLTTSARPNYLSNPALTVPGHIHWGVLHLFAAITFLTFQVIAHPAQTTGNAALLSAISNGVVDMEALRGIPAADKAISIMSALKPLYQGGPGDDDPSLRQKRRETILHAASQLPFPFLDSPGQRAHRGQRNSHSVSPPAHSNSPLATAPSSCNGHDTSHILSSTPLTNGSNRNFVPVTQFAEATQQTLYVDRRGPTLPTQTQNSGDDTFWSSAVGVETGDWARLIHDVAPKSKPAER